ncbi:MDR family oxidoreductase [Amphritea sp. 2_MG-2023]|uniref:acrylyl-CoA reductase (NADPH) n=1 Tax=Amphritea TaxID=515417 RepID=UPI001C073FE5|nr:MULTISPECIES: MDR family oxidoreductase [Amphritea]MBU2966102.1 oxidoreductase [Amphritea atlantica]MDO6418243.1 MDR family oxidoreductase [Amphritea sp. 2_MG-2023]
MFNALVLEQEEGKTLSSVKTLELSDLPDEEVLVEVSYSSLNYKDGLAVTGTGKIVHKFPMVPGIDLAGVVKESRSPDYQPGDQVIMTGWSVGERYWGGYSQYARIKPEWLVKMPEGMDAAKAMSIGTAGLTAMLCVMALEESGITPDRGTVVVTGAAGGVGSVAVAILSQLGYTVAAVTGRESTHEYLRGLGASELLSRTEMAEPARPLEKQRWAGGIDTVGDTMLARVLAETDYRGTVAACGLAGGYKLPTTVMPFILRNVRLQGVDSVMCPVDIRTTAWNRLLTDLPDNALGEIANVIGLSDVPQAAADIVAGKIQGRTLVDPNK